MACEIYTIKADCLHYNKKQAEPVIFNRHFNRWEEYTGVDSDISYPYSSLSRAEDALSQVEESMGRGLTTQYTPVYSNLRVEKTEVTRAQLAGHAATDFVLVEGDRWDFFTGDDEDLLDGRELRLLDQQKLDEIEALDLYDYFNLDELINKHLSFAHIPLIPTREWLYRAIIWEAYKKYDHFVGTQRSRFIQQEEDIASAVRGGEGSLCAYLRVYERWEGCRYKLRVCAAVTAYTGLVGGDFSDLLMDNHDEEMI